MGNEGSVVAFVLENGPAAKAGLRVGDRVLRWGEEPVPEFKAPKRHQPEYGDWRASMRKLSRGLVVGRPVAIEVQRGTETLKLSIVPVSEAEIHRAMGGDGKPFPLPEGTTATVAYVENFDAIDLGRWLPEGFRPYEGNWRVLANQPACPSPVLVQDRPVLPWAVLLVTGERRELADGHVKVRFQPASGVADQAGGIIFRANDPKNFYLARASALEDTWTLYVVKEGVRTALEEMRIDPPAAGSWHTMEVWCEGDSLKATFDGQHTVEANDATFSSGWCGLWTRADGVTRFDDLEVGPSEKR
jgi:hypothetical protein